MIYRPDVGERLWDSWLFAWAGRVHLFYLASQGGAGRIGHAVSGDLVHWERERDLVPPHWPFTGMVVRDGERFVMAIGEAVDAVQTTVFYASDDLEHWRPMAGASRLGPAGPHYVSKPGERWPQVWWRDPYLFRVAGDSGWHALLCAAQPGDGPAHSGAVVGHVRTDDFATWEHLPSLEGPTGRFYHNEVPEHFEAEGRHYLLFSTGSCAGIRLQTPGRRETVGTYYMVSDRLEGPYRLPTDPLLVGAGGYRMGPYVGRVIEWAGERLLYHHVREDGERWDGVWSTPKRLTVEANGDLAVGYWPGLGAMEARTLAERPSVELAHEVAGTARRVVAEAADVQVTARVRGGGGRCGVVLRVADGQGVMVALDLELGRVEIGVGRRSAVYGWGADVTHFIGNEAADREQRFVLDTCGVALEGDRPYALRVLGRGDQFEVYLEERWVFTTHVPEASAAGGVELFAERGRAVFEEVRITALERWTRAASVGEVRMDGSGG